MSYSLDVNVLLYASDRSSDRHLRARRFVEVCAAGPEIKIGGIFDLSDSLLLAAPIAYFVIGLP